MNIRKAITIVTLSIAGLLILKNVAQQFPSEPEIANSNQNGRSIVAFGDSLTAGAGATKGKAWPDLIGSSLGADVVNLGRNGDTSASALARIETVLSHKPNYVIMTLGGNDLKGQVPLEETSRNLGEIFERIKATGAMVVYLSISPPLVGDNWNMALRDLCRQHQVLFVSDILEGLWGDSEYMADGVHPNDAGHAFIAAKVSSTLAKHITP